MVSFLKSWFCFYMISLFDNVTCVPCGRKKGKGNKKTYYFILWGGMSSTFCCSHTSAALTQRHSGASDSNAKVQAGEAGMSGATGAPVTKYE